MRGKLFIRLERSSRRIVLSEQQMLRQDKLATLNNLIYFGIQVTINSALTHKNNGTSNYLLNSDLRVLQCGKEVFYRA